jgi:hypothetical protein
MVLRDGCNREALAPADVAETSRSRRQPRDVASRRVRVVIVDIAEAPRLGGHREMRALDEAREWSRDEACEWSRARRADVRPPFKGWATPDGAWRRYEAPSRRCFAMGVTARHRLRPRSRDLPVSGPTARCRLETRAGSHCRRSRGAPASAVMVRRRLSTSRASGGAQGELMSTHPSKGRPRPSSPVRVARGRVY